MSQIILIRLLEKDFKKNSQATKKCIQVPHLGPGPDFKHTGPKFKLLT